MEAKVLKLKGQLATLWSISAVSLDLTAQELAGTSHVDGVKIWRNRFPR